MRITVNLSLFFYDHRSLAKIFVNKNMKCIKDVEKHISHIFKINDFYLKCDNQYLPPTEDVQILNYDDVVWAMPTSEHSIVSTTATESVVFPNDANLSDKTGFKEKRKKKKKRKHADIAVVVDSENSEIINEPEINNKRSISKKPKVQTPAECEMNDSPVPKKKKKKQKKVSEVIPNECKNGMIQDHATNEINSPDKDHVMDTAIKDSGRGSLCSSKSDSPTCQSNNVVKSLVHTFETKTCNPGKYLGQNIINHDLEKRINIVKTIIVSNKTNDVKSEEQKMETPQTTLESCNTSVNPTTVDNGFQDENLSTNDLTSLSAVSCNDSDINVTKRQRKRTRRRKNRTSLKFEEPQHNNFVHKDLNETCNNFVDKELNERAPRHIRFDEESNTKNEIIAESLLNVNMKDFSEEGIVTLNESSVKVVELSGTQESKWLNSNISSKDKEMEENKQEVIEINESADMICEPSQFTDLPKNNIRSPEITYNNKEIEECILKQPITQNSQPRIGDVIAFKILRLSENYTPEVSSTIVGKVINYKQETEEITFDVVYGREQCVEPVGKFSLSQEESEEQSAEPKPKFECLWSSLLEPRLIFP